MNECSPRMRPVSSRRQATTFMQGLPAKGITDPEGKKPGWQKNAGELDDRDLKFFDTVLDWAKKEYKIDPSRIYATGHSNGGAFTYLLWSERAAVFAAFAPTAAQFGPKGAKAKPKPALVIADEKDEIVPFASQQRNIEFLRRLDKIQ